MKQVFFAIATLVLITLIMCCGVGTYFSSHSVVLKTEQPTTPPNKRRAAAIPQANPEREAEFSKVVDELIAAKGKLADIESGKPEPPLFEKRQWSTFDKKYQTEATLVTTDGVTAKLKKVDGSFASVPKAKLIAGDRIYLDKSLEAIQKFDSETNAWTSQLATLKNQINTLESKIDASKSAKVSDPDKAKVVQEIKTRFQKTRQVKAEEERIAAKLKKEAEQAAAAQAQRDSELAMAAKARQEAAEVKKDQQKRLDLFMAFITLADAETDIVKSVSIEEMTAIITVNNVWFIKPYQIRFQSAQNLWEGWATIANPGNPDHARIKIVDSNGNEVGGSRFIAGSMIWVEE